MRVIKNTSVWRTDDIMKIVRRVAIDELDVEHRKAVVISIIAARGRRCHGRAACPGHWMRLMLPSRGDDIDSVGLAALIAHEMAHLRGIKHRQMIRHPRYTWVNGYREVFSWAKDYPIRKKSPAQVKVQVSEERNDLPSVSTEENQAKNSVESVL